MVPEELKKKFSRGNIDSLYFFYGENTALQEEAVRAAQDKLFPDRDPGLNLSVYDAQVHAPAEIIQSARTIPFAAPRRLIIVKRAHAFRESQWKAFESYFARPVSHCCLILTGEKLGVKGNLLALIKKNGSAVKFENPRWEREIKKAISAAVQRHGKRITPEALSLFADTIGGDGQAIASEAEKIALYCMAKKTISVEDLEAILACGHTSTIFKLVDGIGHGKLKVALAHLGDLADAGMPPLVILKMIARQFRMICRVQEGLRLKETPGVIARRINLKSEFIVKGIIQQARGWPAGSLGKVFESLFQADCRLKSSRIKGKWVLEGLILTLVRLRLQAPAA